MISGLLGFLAASVIFTFFPTLGLRISDAIKQAWAYLRGRLDS